MPLRVRGTRKGDQGAEHQSESAPHPLQVTVTVSCMPDVLCTAVAGMREYTEAATGSGG